MLDQLIIGTNRSYDDFEASVKERKIVDGKKKVIKESVPFSNVVYDFSKINGEFYWEEKNLQYTFEITANNPEELADKIIVFKLWVMNTASEDLHDPYISDYHFIATFSDISVDESEVDKATIVVTFTAYPYMIANVPKTISCQMTANKASKLVFSNISSHRVVPTFNSNVPFNLTYGTATFSVLDGETTDDYFKFEPGLIEITLESTKDGTVTITFYEEVF